MKTLVKLATIIIVAIIVFGSCTSQKELMYLSNLDTTITTEFFPMDRPGYKVQYQDILYVDIFTMNPHGCLLSYQGPGLQKVWTGNTWSHLRLI